MELPEIDDLRFIAGVADAATLTAAAHRWGVSVSTVSKRLARVERRLGVVLVNRGSRRFTLTDEGRRYTDGAQAILGQIEDLEQEVGRRRHELHGRISVHSSIGLGRAHVAPLLGRFAAQHPDLRVYLELSHVPVHVGGSHFDFAVRVGRLLDSSLHAQLLHPNRRVVCAAPAYLRERGEPRSLGDLADHDCIVIRESDSDYARWQFERDGEVIGVRVGGTLASNDGAVATEWCLGGLGLIMRSLWQVAPLLEQGRLVRVLPDVATPSAHIVAIHPDDRLIPRRVTATIDHLRSGLAARLPTVV